MNVADDDSGLTEQDRRAIAEIERELDAELAHDLPPDPSPTRVPEPPPGAAPSSGPAHAARPSPDPEPAATARPGPRVAPRRQRREPRRWSTGALVLAFVAGAVSSAAGVLFTLLTARPAHRLLTPARPSVEAPAPSSSVQLGTSRGHDPDVARAPTGAVSDSPRPATDRGVDAPAASLPAEQREPSSSQARTRREVRAATLAWIDAQRHGDLDAQMRFYPPRVPVFYRSRDVDRRTVRAEKARVFGRASTVELTVGEPAIEVDVPDVRARFRKRYVIQGPHVRRRGEVVQELRWRKHPDGWKIVAERDAEVIVPDPGARVSRNR